MLSVYKYPVPPSDEFSMGLPQGAKVLSVQEQNGTPQMWVLVDSAMPTESRNFRVAGTGHLIEQSADELRFVCTFQMRGGSLVFHVFEIVAKSS